MCYILYQKGSPSFSPLKAFYLATLGGARALHLEDKIGSFLVGKEAVFELNALRADFRNLQHNKDHHRRNIAIQACGF